ncbi:hypothetical protein R3P38DRAFT_2414634, partial [Favolaschia claudopus]
LYSKGGGKNGKHSAISEHHNISACSYIDVQVYEHSHARTFSAYPQATSSLHTYQFLCRLGVPPTVNPSGLELTVDDAPGQMFRDLNANLKRLYDAVSASRSR